MRFAFAVALVPTCLLQCLLPIARVVRRRAARAASVFPLSLSRKRGLLPMEPLINLGEENLTIVPTDAFDGVLGSFEFAGVGAHHRLPLLLSYGVPAQIERFADRHLVLDFIFVATLLRLGAPHGELAGGN